MKKLLSFVLALLAVTSAAQTTIVGGGGGFASGSTASGCTAYSLVYVDSSGNLACALAPVNGSVSTAGRSILTIADTITGSSATSNFLNITGTFPATLSAATNGSYFSTVLDNDAQNQSGVYSVISGSAGSAFNAALRGEVTANGTGAIGVYGNANTSIGTAIGVWGNRGVLATNSFGGYFSIGAGAYPTGLAALGANNGTAAENIFVAMDNGTAVLTVADGGATTTTGVWNWTANSSYFSTNVGLFFGASPNDGVSGIVHKSNQTPDTVSLVTPGTSNSWQLTEFNDLNAFDFNNGRCGTSACTSPALIIHSPDQVTTEYAQISTDTSGAAGFQSNFAEIRVGGTKTAITEGSAQAVVRIGIPTSTNVYGATVYYTVYDINGANYTSRAGQVRVQGGNSGGTATCTINAAQDTEAEDGSQIATSNAATLTYTWTNVVSTTNCDLSLNAASSQGANTYAITWTAVVTGNSSAITVVGQ